MRFPATTGEQVAVRTELSTVEPSLVRHGGRASYKPKQEWPSSTEACFAGRACATSSQLRSHRGTPERAHKRPQPVTFFLCAGAKGVDFAVAKAFFEANRRPQDGNLIRNCLHRSSHSHVRPVATSWTSPVSKKSRAP